MPVVEAWYAAMRGAEATAGAAPCEQEDGDRRYDPNVTSPTHSDDPKRAFSPFATAGRLLDP
ncbi:MAG: hypothetical protein NVS4B2_23260 [Chloroflexota bacterium]